MQGLLGHCALTFRPPLAGSRLATRAGDPLTPPARPRATAAAPPRQQELHTFGPLRRLPVPLVSVRSLSVEASGRLVPFTGAHPLAPEADAAAAAFAFGVGHGAGAGAGMGGAGGPADMAVGAVPVAADPAAGLALGAAAPAPGPEAPVAPGMLAAVLPRLATLTVTSEELAGLGRLLRGHPTLATVTLRLRPPSAWCVRARERERGGYRGGAASAFPPAEPLRCARRLQAP